MLPLAGFPEGRVLAGEAYSLPTPGSEGPPACVPGPAPGSGRTGSISHVLLSGFPGDASGKESACQSWRCKRLRFSSSVEKIPQRRAWHSTPVFLPGEFHGQRSLAGYSPWGFKRLGHKLVTKRQQQYNLPHFSSIVLLPW